MEGSGMAGSSATPSLWNWASAFPVVSGMPVGARCGFRVPSALETGADSAATPASTPLSDEQKEAVFADWASATAGGILIGLFMGGYKSSLTSRYTRDDCGTYMDIRNRNYKVPMVMVDAANGAAAMSMKLGFLAGAFSATRSYMVLVLPGHTAALLASDDETMRSAGTLLGSPYAEGVVPTSVAGTLVGTLYGVMYGGLRGGTAGCMIGLGLSTAGGVALAATEVLSRRVEAWIEARGGDTGTKKKEPAAPRPVAPQGPVVKPQGESREMMLERLQFLRDRERERGLDLAEDKAELKDMIKRLAARQ
mmetsp:Transcript_9459/g.18339  ORF Transcript_9459/g.18339 Transcript_9459/m.18339 type:complete len:308 (-) Transcript_9459:53-976(-)